MSWLYERKVRHSEKNGEILCQRLFGRWEVHVGETHMSSRLLHSMWNDAYLRMPEGYRPKSALMLGLAAGDNVAILEHRFPGCRMTAVEWDPEMVRIADEFGLFPPELRPEIIVADAAMAIQSLAGPYDFVLVDVFTDSKVARSAFSPGFFANVGRLLSPQGLALVNAFREPELLAVASKELEKACDWQWRFNHLGIFRKKRSTIG